MSELKLTDVELTGERRQARLAEWYLHYGVGKQGPSAGEAYIVRPILHDGIWAMRQMLAGKECECTLGRFRFGNDGLEKCFNGKWEKNNREWERWSFWTRTDWQLIEPESDTPVADSLREKMDNAGYVAMPVDIVADAIAALEERLAKLEAGK